MKRARDVVVMAMSKTFGYSGLSDVCVCRHAGSYTWKRLPTNGARDMVVMEMSKTLDDNGFLDESEEYEALGMYQYV